jgi:hypothetical protein
MEKRGASQTGSRRIGVQDVNVSRQKSRDMLQAYVRDADLFRDHARTAFL